MPRRRRRKCRDCGQLYEPEPRNVYHQRYCSRVECHRVSKAVSQRRWLRSPKGLHYFRGPDSGSKDALVLSGTIPVAKFFKPASKKVTVVIGNFRKDFTLGAKGQGTAGACRFQMKGKMKRGVFKATPARFALTVKGEPLLAALQEFGFANKTTAKAGEQVDISIIIMVDTLGYETDFTMLYKATQGKSGKAAKAK